MQKRAFFTSTVNPLSQLLAYSHGNPATRHGCNLTLDRLINHLVPDRIPHLRVHTQQELKATLVVKIPIDEAAAKIRSGPPIDAEKDYDTDIWAGVINVKIILDDIENCPELNDSVPTPEHVLDFVKKKDLFTRGRGTKPQSNFSASPSLL